MLSQSIVFSHHDEYVELASSAPFCCTRYSAVCLSVHDHLTLSSKARIHRWSATSAFHAEEVGFFQDKERAFDTAVVRVERVAEPVRAALEKVRAGVYV